MVSVSVIIPTLNEAEWIGKVITHLKSVASESDSLEIIVVDGGSSDQTKELAQKADAIVMDSPKKGRASQMNFGANMATGKILYFLHVDSFPPRGFDSAINSATASGYEGGCFRMRFDSGHPLLSFSGWFTRFSNILCRGGDQSLFVTRDLFDKIGGYREWPIMEDIEIISRMRGVSNFKIFDTPIITSARKYKRNGHFRLQFHFAMIHLRYWLGASPEYLHSYYKRHII